MVDENKHTTPKVRLGRIRWLKDTVRVSIEAFVSQRIGNEWKIRDETDMSEFAYHRTAVVSDGSFSVFLKYSKAEEAHRQFEIELTGLQTLSRKAEVLIPQPLGIVQVDGGTILMLEALEAVKRTLEHWRQIGSTLARIHRVNGKCFGYERNGFWGPLSQDNTTSTDWVTFFRERRLLPLLKTASESGNIPLSIVSRIEKLLPRLPELCGPEVVPTLLHGDAQQNNFISTTQGTYVIDPAVYYGHPEMDLALIDSWQPVPSIVFDSYRDVIPIDSGFSERRGLWRLPLYLAAVALEGTMHLNRLIDTLRPYE